MNNEWHEGDVICITLRPRERYMLCERRIGDGYWRLLDPDTLEQYPGMVLSEAYLRDCCTLISESSL